MHKDQVEAANEWSLKNLAYRTRTRTNNLNYSVENEQALTQPQRLEESNGQSGLLVWKGSGGTVGQWLPTGPEFNWRCSLQQSPEPLVLRRTSYRSERPLGKPWAISHLHDTIDDVWRRTLTTTVGSLEWDSLLEGSGRRLGVGYISQSRRPCSASSIACSLSYTRTLSWFVVGSGSDKLSSLYPSIDLSTP